MDAHLSLDDYAPEREHTPAIAPAHVTSIQRLAEAALETLKHPTTENRSDRNTAWIAELGDAVMAQPDSVHQAVVTSLMGRGVSSQDLFQHYVPEAARYIGAKWVSDEASFVDVTTGAARLQALFRDSPDEPDLQGLSSARIALDDPVLMVIPSFEHHSLGAFVAADHLRRQGISTRMAIGLSEAELEAVLRASPFKLIGISLATQKSMDIAAGLIQRIRNRIDRLPPIVVGGRITETTPEITQCTKADYVVTSPDEILRLCHQTTGARPRDFEQAE